MSEKVESRNRTVLDAAIEAARAVGFTEFTRAEVAEIAGVAAGSVNNAFGTMEGLREAVVVEAIAHEMLGIVGQALVARHPLAVAASPDLKARALALFAE